MFRKIPAFRQAVSRHSFFGSVPINSAVPQQISPFFRKLSSKRSVNELITMVKEKDVSGLAKIAKLQPRLIAEQTSNDNSALHEAARIGSVEMIQELSKHFDEHFNVNHKCHCRYERTPLHYAVENEHYDAAELLMKMGANPDITDERGRTALDYALNKSNDQLALLIHANGGSAKKMDSKDLGMKLSTKLFAQKYQPPKINTEEHYNKFKSEIKRLK